MFDAIFSAAKGLYNDTKEFFDNAEIELEDIIGYSRGDDDKGIFSDIAGAAATAMGSPKTSSSSTVSSTLGQVEDTGTDTSSKDISLSSVDLGKLERQWLLRLREYSRVDED
jgi:hypothetical protein